MKSKSSFSYKVYGDLALFTDPITRIGGAKMSYPLPTYEAIRNITESIYWKPTIAYIIDKVRVVNKIEYEAKNVTWLTGKKNGRDRERYTYLRNVEYEVLGHIEWNKQRPDLRKDRNMKKHLAILERSIQRGGRRDIFLGTRECQAIVEPCSFNTGKGYYDNTGEYYGGVMVHGIDYPDSIASQDIDATEDKNQKNLKIRLWQSKMEDGIISFPRPDDSSLMIRDLKDNKPGMFLGKVMSVDDTYKEVFD